MLADHRRKRLAAVAAATGLASITMVGLAPMADAASTIYTNNNCGESATQYFDTNFCPNSLTIDYHPGFDGSQADFEGNVPNYTSAVVGSTTDIYVLWDYAGGSTDGYGQTPRNNCASAYDLSDTNSYTVYFHPDYLGHAQTFGPDSGGNFDSTLRNNNASQKEN